MLVYDYVDRISGESVRICYTQSIIHKDYLLWLYQFFYDRGYTSNLQSREYIRVFKYKKKHIEDLNLILLILQV